MASKNHMAELIDGLAAGYERRVKAAASLTEEEKAALSKWESKNVSSGGIYKTTDWPGWDVVISRITH